MFFPVAVLILAALPTPDLPSPDSVAARIDRYVTARTELGRFSGAILVARGDRVIFRKGYGYADVEARKPFTPETPQEIASISKMFTAMATLKLRDRGRLKLEDSLAQWVPDCPAEWRPIRIQQLMRHTSGIPDYEEALEIGSAKYMEFMQSPGATRRIIEEARTKSLDFEPGTKFHYSNTAYILLSQIVERAAKEPFATFVSRELLKPAGMKHAGVFDGGLAPPSVARGYTHGDLGWPRVLAGVPLTAGHLTLVPHLPLTPPAGDAGIYATVDDLLRWSRAMDGGRLIPAAEVAEVFTPGLEGYGYGWFIQTAFDRIRYRHNGILPGHVSDLVKFPADSITIVTLSNLDRTRLDRVMRDVTAIVLGTPWDMPVQGKVVALTPDEIAAVAGVYRMSDGKALTVKPDGDLLAAALEGRYTAGLVPLSPTEFYMPLGDGRTTFTIGADGRATRVNLRYGGEDHVAERSAP